jgi:translation initiation factor 2B subunit (eIF-2B alpha/beta/delta family)
MNTSQRIQEVINPIRDDLQSGAAELALQGISAFRTLMSEAEKSSPDAMRTLLVEAAQALVKAHPAMAPLFHLGNEVLLATRGGNSTSAIIASADEALDKFETRLCESAAKIAEHAFSLIPNGDMVFAYSFSSTVVSSLLNAKARGRVFRVLCTEARPSMEGRKLATVLSQAGVEVVHTFDSAMGLMLPQCRIALMGCDCVGRPGIVNKVGSWLLALACKEKGIPLVALAGTEKFVADDRFFEFEDFERPGAEVWADSPAGVRVQNKQYEPIPWNWISSVVTEHGIIQEQGVEKYINEIDVHPALEVAGAFAK